MIHLNIYSTKYLKFKIFILWDINIFPNSHLPPSPVREFFPQTQPLSNLLYLVKSIIRQPCWLLIKSPAAPQCEIWNVMNIQPRTSSFCKTQISKVFAFHRISRQQCQNFEMFDVLGKEKLSPGSFLWTFVACNWFHLFESVAQNRLSFMEKSYKNLHQICAWLPILESKKPKSAFLFYLLSYMNINPSLGWPIHVGQGHLRYLET